MANKWSDVYPRPQLVRSDWLSLDGEWNFSIKKDNERGLPQNKGLIKVPFCPESKLSGINKIIFRDDVMLYGRSFQLPEEWKGKRLILHFGAVDRLACVNINGKDMCEHNGGYLPFEVDITEYVNSHLGETISFMICNEGEASNENHINFSSREFKGQEPQIVLQTQS